MFVSSLASLNQDAINEKIGEFLSENILNAQQQGLVKNIFNYARKISDISRLDLNEKSPFDNYDVLTLFGENNATGLQIVNAIHDSVSVAS